VVASSSCSVMAARSGDLFDDDTKDIFAAIYSTPPSDLIARSTSSFYKQRAKNFFRSANFFVPTHPSPIYSWAASSYGEGARMSSMTT
jgi:hypothetical protein